MTESDGRRSLAFAHQTADSCAGTWLQRTTFCYWDIHPFQGMETTTLKGLPSVSGNLLERELETIEERQIHLASFDQLNDPFEFTVGFRFDSPPEVIARHLAGTSERTGQRMAVMGVIQDSQTPAGRIILEKTTLSSIRNFGVCCFTEDITDEALWAYYGEGHTGIAIVYDSTPAVMTDAIQADPPLFPLRIEYTEKPATVAYFEITPDILAKCSVGRKSLKWQHEKEWRLVGGAPGRRDVPRRMMHGIALGLRTSPEVRDRVAQFAERHDLRLYRMNKKPLTYELEILELIKA